MADKEIRDRVQNKVRDELRHFIILYEQAWRGELNDPKALDKMANQILSISELAVVDRDAKLPTLSIEWNKMPFLSGVIASNMRQAINEVIALKVEGLFKEGWVKEIK